MQKKILITCILIFIIIIIVILMIFALLKKDNVNKNVNVQNIVVNEQSTIEEDTIEEVTDESEFYRISQTVNNYYDSINKSKYYLSDGTNMSDDKEVKKSILDLLSKEYIEKNNISVDNVYEYIENIENNVRFIPFKINRLEAWGVNKYLAYGELVNMDSSNNTMIIYIFVNVDVKNNTFSIEPINKKYNNMEEIEYTNNMEEIEANDYNEYTELNMLKEDILKEKFNNFKILILNDNKYAYDYLLNSQYKEKRFNNYEKFQEFFKKNNQRFIEMTLAKYQINNYENYTEYVCVDKNDNYYIFNENTVSDFDVLLDTYTIDLPTFIDKYNNGEEQLKVGMNIEKVISAINAKDYDYVYNKLDESFRNSNFNSIERFESFVQNNFFDVNKAEYTKFSKEGKTYIYNLQIKQLNDENDQNAKGVTIIMKLLGGTDFVMSFSVD